MRNTITGCNLTIVASLRDARGDSSRQGSLVSVTDDIKYSFTMMNVPLAPALVYAFSAGSDVSRFPKIVRCCPSQEQKAASLGGDVRGGGRRAKGVARRDRVHLHALFSGLSINGAAFRNAAGLLYLSSAAWMAFSCFIRRPTTVNGSFAERRKFQRYSKASQRDVGTSARRKKFN